jgi:hypothetical protein
MNKCMLVLARTGDTTRPVVVGVSALAAQAALVAALDDAAAAEPGATAVHGIGTPDTARPRGTLLSVAQIGDAGSAG